MITRVAIAYNFNDQDWLGGKNYFASLFGALRHLEDAGIKLVFVTGKKTITSLPEEFPELEVIRTSLMDRLHPLWLLRQFTIRKLDSDPLLKRLLVGHQIDILSHSGHLGRNSAIKCLPWLYDFQFMHLPEYWEPKHIKWAERRYRSACKNADGIIVSSNDALKDLDNFAPWCQLPKHVLQFVSNPVDFAKIQPKEDICKKYDLPEKYFYLPNQFWSNKNHRLVIDALANLKEKGIDVTVACSGKTFDGRKPEYFQQLMDYSKQRGVSALFKVLGMIPYSDLQSLMRYATAVINPSKFEGWSTTVEEAKTFHQKLLLSNIGVHKEQAAQVGQFFDVDDPEALAHLLNERLQQQVQYATEEDISSSYQERLSMFGKRYLDLVRNTTKNEYRSFYK